MMSIADRVIIVSLEKHRYNPRHEPHEPAV